MTYYSALHYAAKAEKSATSAANSAQVAQTAAAQASQASGKIIQLGFDGAMQDGVLVFTHAPSGVEVPYELLDDYEYELDLSYTGADLSSLAEMYVKNGSDTIRFVSALHRSSTDNARVADMDAVMRYNSDTGYRWLFKATFKIAPNGAKVFLLYPVVAAKDYSDKTNCITEIPQDIKLELVDGELTLKAGSKVYVPNGKNADGSNRFDELVLSRDLTITSATAVQYLICVRADGVTLFQRDASRSVSGAGVTTSSGFAYDTELNLLRWYNSSGELQEDRYSLPICIVTGNSSIIIETVDQVFNGFGYIGSTIFALPGVKGLAPNGRNADGSLRNEEFTVDKVLTVTGSYPSDYKIMLKSDSIGAFLNLYYDDANNINVDSDNPKVNSCIAGTMTRGSGGVITSLTPKLPFQAVDRNDSSWVAQQAMPSGKYIDLTLGASGATYTAPANGWFLLYCKTLATSTCWAQLVNNSKNGFVSRFSTDIRGTDYSIYLPVNKGNIMLLQYSNIDLSNSWDKFRFYYAEGENS